MRSDILSGDGREDRIRQGVQPRIRIRMAIEAAVMRLKQLGKPSGLLTTDPVFGRACLDLGSAFLAIGTDAGLLTRGSDALLRNFGGGNAVTGGY